MANSERSGMLPPGKYKKITVRTRERSHTFTGAPELHIVAVTDTYFITMGDEVVWQQRVENGIAEGVEITVET